MQVMLNSTLYSIFLTEFRPFFGFGVFRTITEKEKKCREKYFGRNFGCFSVSAFFGFTVIRTQGFFPKRNLRLTYVSGSVERLLGTADRR